MVVEIGLHLLGSGQGPVAGCNEYGNESSGTRKGGEFLDLPIEYFSSQEALGTFIPVAF
jgi:hypothetical protein